MNLREGTRRLALLLGAAGAIAGGFASYMELQPVMRQRADHQRFEQLANSDVVQQARKDLGIAALAAQYGGKALDAPKPVFTIGPPPPPPPSTLPGDFNGWDIEPSVVNKGGISTIGWNKGYLVF